VRTTLFGNRNPLGETIIINNIPFKVKGTLNSMGEALSGSDYDNMIIMPHTTAGIKIFGKKTYMEIYLSVTSKEIVASSKNLLREYFRNKHRLARGQKDNFRIRTSQEKMQMAEYIWGALTMLMIGVASISLFVGGIGIMNIMIVSVNERIREIGIRMAIGAKKKDILIQFLIESTTLSAGGGLIGIITGVVGYYLIAYFVDWPYVFSFESIIISFLFACLVGIFFGYYPAKKASNLKPIDALRYE